MWSPPEDCNDLRGDIHPDAVELCDGLDNNCDGSVDEGLGEIGYRDVDGDDYGDEDVTSVLCNGLPAGWSLLAGDCDDTNNLTFPGARERCDKEDNDCDGTIDEDTDITVYTDADGDGYGDPATEAVVCFEEVTSDTVGNGNDCDDTSDLRAPDLAEVCFDQIDNDCDTAVDESDCSVVTPELYAGSGALASATLSGDYNGDGTPDIAAGAPQAVHSSSFSYGTVFVLNGPTDRNAMDLAELSEAQIYNSGSSAAFGSALVAIPDADGDGYDELAVGAPQSSEIFVFRGPLPTTLASSSSDMRVSDATGAQLGQHFDGTYDLTGDGAADLLVGLGYNNQSAAASVLPIQDKSHQVRDGIALTWNTTWGSAPPLGVGELTGDGDADVVATFNESVYVVYGPITQDTEISATSTRATTSGGDAFGSVLLTADFNDDGYEDLVAGAPQSSTTAARAGAVYLFWGPLSGSLGEADAAATITGEANYDRAGGTLAASDRDQDGLSDLIVGASAQYADFSATTSGTYTVLGPFSGALSLADADARFQDPEADMQYPTLSGGADVTGDGVEDVLVGAPEVRISGSLPGIFYLLPRTF